MTWSTQLSIDHCFSSKALSKTVKKCQKKAFFYIQNVEFIQESQHQVELLSPKQFQTTILRTIAQLTRSEVGGQRSSLLSREYWFAISVANVNNNNNIGGNVNNNNNKNKNSNNVRIFNTLLLLKSYTSKSSMRNNVVHPFGVHLPTTRLVSLYLLLCKLLRSGDIETNPGHVFNDTINFSNSLTIASYNVNGIKDRKKT